jgi:hypothetical protein
MESKHFLSSSQHQSLTSNALSSPLIPHASTSLTPPSALSTSNALGEAGYIPHSSSSSLLFIDPTVENYQSLIAGVAPGTEIHVLSPLQNAIAQITNTLTGRSGISSLQVLSHGEAGGLDFASMKLDLGDLEKYSGQLQSWAKALTPDADILLYGCDVAAGEQGQTFVQQLAKLTGADVAASTNLTGSAGLGGDWNLEFSTGAIETSETFQPWAQAAYSHVLASFIEGGPAIPIDSGALLNLPALLNLVGGTLSVGLSGTGTPDDRLGIKTQGSGAGQIDVLGTSVTYGGVPIGTVTGGNGTTPLDISLNAAAIPAALQALTRSITFENISDVPSTATRTASFALNGLLGGTIPLLTQNIDVIGVNDAPTVAAPTSISVTANVAIPLTGVSFADVDAGNGNVTATFSVADGTLTAASGNGVTVGGTATNTTLSGTLAAINTFIAGGSLTYTTPANATTNRTLGVSIDDNGNTGIVGALSSGVTNVDLIVGSNQPSPQPPISLPGGTVTYTENGAAIDLAPGALLDIPGLLNLAGGVLSVGLTGNGTIDDLLKIKSQGSGAGQIDVLGNSITYQGVPIGTFTGGNGTSPLDITFNSGAIPAAVQTLLRTITYENLSDLPSTLTRTISFTLNGLGGVISSPLTQTVNVISINDAPTVTAPSSIAVTEDVTAPLLGISFGDVDAGNGSLTATFTVANGTLAATSGGGVTTGGTATNFTLSGTLAAINTFLSNGSLTYTTASNSTTTQTLGVSINDNGNTGLAGALNSGVTNVNLTVNAVNDAPVLTVPTAQTVNEDTNLTFNSVNGNRISLSDVDAGSSPLKVTLSAGKGTLALGSTAGLSNLTGNGSANLSFEGTASAIDSALNNLVYLGNPNYNGTDAINLLVNDQGNTGSGGALSDSKTINLTLTSVNDAPILTDTDVRLSPVKQNNGLPVGAVGTLVSQLADLTGGNGQNNVSDVDTNPATGIAITAVNASNGAWFYSTNNGVNWSPLSGTSASNALLLAADANTRIYFQPNTGFLGTVTDGITFRAWDQTTGSNGTTANTTSNGGATAFSSATDTAAITVATRKNGIDFDNDGKTDLLWRNSTTGKNSIWLMNGTTLSTSVSLPTVPDSNWKIAGVSDFNGDGKEDILWRNSATGKNTIWQMNGTSLSTSIALSTVPDSNWKIAGVSDFNGDGKEDILWRNSATGKNTIWQMNGTSLSTSTVLATVPDSNWQIIGISDFNGDGKTDLLWRNSATGKNTIWQMNGTSLSTSTALATVPDSNWKIAGVSDFNGDGKEDILWRNSAIGKNTIWQMNGTTLSTSTSLPTVPDSNWKIAGIGDLSLDSKTDLLWRSNATGKNVIWQMNGTTYNSSTSLPDVTDTNWRPYISKQVV